MPAGRVPGPQPASLQDLVAAGRAPRPSAPLQLLRHLRNTLIFEPYSGVPEAVCDLLRQTFAYPDPKPPGHLVPGLIPHPGRHVQIEVGLASKTCPRSLSNSPTSVLASTTSRKQLAAYVLDLVPAACQVRVLRPAPLRKGLSRDEDPPGLPSRQARPEAPPYRSSA